MNPGQNLNIPPADPPDNEISSIDLKFNCWSEAKKEQNKPLLVRANAHGAIFEIEQFGLGEAVLKIRGISNQSLRDILPGDVFQDLKQHDYFFRFQTN